ncbi:MAG: BatA domain-containing protein [Planctomycetaceae bacterium]
MSFVQTTFLIGSVAVAIPVIVHLLSRFQVRRLELGTIRFLQEVIQDGAQRRRIRRWFLLFTRALLMLLLALLFARPFLAEESRRDGNRLRIVVMDRSASMGMPGTEGRLLDDAVEAAMTATSDLGTDANVLWAWFDGTVEPLPDNTVRPMAPRAATGNTSYLAALRWARDRLNAFPEAAADVVLVTDLQQSGFAAETLDTEALNFPVDVPVNVIDVGRPAASNLAVTSAAVTSVRQRGDRRIQLSATLFNYGSLPFEEIPATATAFDGKRTVRLKKSVNIPGGEAEEIPFDFGKLNPGLWQITIGVDVADDLAIDNQRFTAVQVAEPIRVLVLDPGSQTDGASGKSYFVVAALQQQGYDASDDASDVDVSKDEPAASGRFLAEAVYLQDEPIRVPDAADHPLVVVTDAGALAADVILQLQNYVAEGGGLLVFAGDQSAEQSEEWQDAGLAPGTMSAPQRSGVMPFRMDSIDAASTMLQPFADPQHGDLRRLAFQKILPVDVSAEAHVLARFDQSRPAVTRHSHGRGSVVWFLASADASWANWTTSPLYLPLIQQMAGDLLGLTGEGPIRFRTVGDDAVLTLLKDGENSVGFRQPGFEERQDALYVVNGSAGESDPTRADIDSFVQHFGLTAADDGEDRKIESVVSERRNELWPWLAAAVFVLVVGEFGLANRTSA